MVKKALITGVSGFAGSFLAEQLLSQKKNKIFGTCLSNKNLQNISHIKDAVELIEVDLTNEEKVNTIIAEVKPDIVFHLAALASPSESYAHPSATIVNNVSVQVNVLEAIKKNKLSDCQILIISSADVYGVVSSKDLPMKETVPFMPTNPYAVSKITQDFLALQYFLSYKMNIVRVRPFNHIGPRQSSGFVVSSFAKKIAEIEKGITEPILRTGNLTTKRDFTDVRDMVVAYDLIMKKGIPGDVYNIGSGVSYKISEVLNKLLSFSKISIKIETDPLFFRPSEVPEIVCDYSKIKKVTNWEPKILLDKTLEDTLDYWRNMI